MSKFKKWVIVLIISSAAFCITCCSSMIALSYPDTRAELGMSQEVATLGLSLYVLGMGFFPLLLGPLSEFYGRRPIYNISFLLFVVWNFPVAFAHNTETWLIGRFFAGSCGAAFLSVAGGSVSDIFAPAEIGAPMGVYTASPFLGPVGGPIISGFINQHLDWRWTWWVTIIWAAVELVLLFFLVPETYLPAKLLRKAKKLRKAGRTDVKAPMELDERSVPRVIATSCTRPFEILATEPMALALCIWTAILLGILYMSFSAWGIVYGAYGFSTQLKGLSFLGLGIGVILGACGHPIWAYYYRRVAEKTGERPPPEEHLRKGLVGAVLCPVSLFWFAFTTYTSVHWSVSEVASVFFGIGCIWSFQATFTYLVDAFRPVAASAMAANSAMRSSFAAGFPLFTSQMFARLGTQWALALCGFLTLAMVPFPFLFFKYGARYRRGSKFANTA
ncbi:major facilitator superfamily domain-containing protein [Leucosporidium creatinivorum]|uniref:Major facilitator superfamily domain-containing protein n=1 Tax=Leucosporidium creatinivorum TaxID=106004 RepID=A0A1Y2EDA6_9BASI|nr:major facilitator superfamily domain-containing protein [Leucosporidium creatinivorum]